MRLTVNSPVLLEDCWSSHHTLGAQQTHLRFTDTFKYDFQILLHNGLDYYLAGVLAGHYVGE